MQRSKANRLQHSNMTNRGIQIKNSIETAQHRKRETKQKGTIDNKKGTMEGE